jgi:hypothetical protein
LMGFIVVFLSPNTPHNKKPSVLLPQVQSSWCRLQAWDP